MWLFFFRKKKQNWCFFPSTIHHHLSTSTIKSEKMTSYAINAKGKLVKNNAKDEMVPVHPVFMKESFADYFSTQMEKHTFPTSTRGYKNRFGVSLFGQIIYFFRMVKYKSGSYNSTKNNCIPIFHVVQYNDGETHQLSDEQVQLSLLLKSYPIPGYVLDQFNALDVAYKAVENKKRKRE